MEGNLSLSLSNDLLTSQFKAQKRKTDLGIYKARNIFNVLEQTHLFEIMEIGL